MLRTNSNLRAQSEELCDLFQNYAQFPFWTLEGARRFHIVNKCQLNPKLVSSQQDLWIVLSISHLQDCKSFYFPLLRFWRWKNHINIVTEKKKKNFLYVLDVPVWSVSA